MPPGSDPPVSAVPPWAVPLCKVKGDRPFTSAMVQDVRFLRVPELLYLPLLGVLSVIAWLAIFSFIQDGLKQVQAAQIQRESEVAAAMPVGV